MKNFFEEKKRSLKFKMAGPGHKLSESSQTSSEPSGSEEAKPKKRVDSIEYQEKRSAVLAAVMQRSQGNINKNEIQKRQTKSNDAEVGQIPEILRRPKGEEATVSQLANSSSSCEENKVGGVYFKCPTLDPSVILTGYEWNVRLEESISVLKAVDPVEAAAVTIKSCNTTEKNEACITIICKYLKNLVEHPDNEKYKCIRMSNPKFTEHVLNVKGGLEFLESIGFVKESIDGEEYLIYKPKNPNDLEGSITTLTMACAHPLILDRDVKIISGIDVMTDVVELPDDFFDLTLAEVKKEQQSRKLKNEFERTLMTKKMRELITPHPRKRKPLYTRIKIRLPNDLHIQGTFSVDEKFKNLREFLEAELVILDCNYNFIFTPGKAIGPEDEEKTFSELDMQPAVQLTLNISADKIALKT